MKRVPDTCATCSDAVKDRVVWECWYTLSYTLDDIKYIPCRRGALPVPPAWCPRRGGAK